MDSLTIGVAEAARRLDVHPDFVYKRVHAKEWPCTRMGRKIRFTEADLTDILRIQRVDAVSRTTRKRSA